MTRYVEAPEGQHVLVTMPDGYRVWPNENAADTTHYWHFIVRGRGERGEPVTISGKYISRVSEATVWPEPD